ncbi:hypothetical protein BDP27DRAFT_940941 [Rhodocollybia butyracea]|uniref:DUF6535 domain-containing protein n=1 Tax=Rhodocollybia butyracea TaxID=206335 RepID=A0A9P5U6P1_9AGAR|nr:hypothetical protein BDP27DRAFT_940941 [Rhodocollybia butyracea]
METISASLDTGNNHPQHIQAEDTRTNDDNHTRTSQATGSRSPSFENASSNGPRSSRIQTEDDGDLPSAPFQPPNLAQPARPRLEKKHLFGLPKKEFYHPQDLSDDYEQRFPEDPMFEEVSETARVWRTYLVESAAFDENMVGEARDGLDALLVFAGLFSAVVISFVVQTTQTLQLSSADVSAALLSELVAIQRAAAQGINVNSVPASMLTPTTKFVPGTLDIWINCLWVVSLVLALVVALASVLVKQWLHRYIAVQSGTPKARSHVRQLRYQGFEEWQVLNIIGALPVVMHLSLLLFFLGLVLFLIPLQLALSWIVGSITVTVYGLYFLSALLPTIRPQCPYKTPLSEFFLAFGVYCQTAATNFRRWLRHESHLVRVHKPANSVLEALEESMADSSLSVEAFQWLFHASSNPSAHRVAFQAIAGLPITIKEKIIGQIFHNRPQDMNSVFWNIWSQCTSFGDPSKSLINPGQELVVERHSGAICSFLHCTPSSLV